MSRVESHPSFEDKLAEKNVAGARLGYLLAALLMPAGVTLDWVLYPKLVTSFFAIRLAAGALAILLLLFSYAPGADRHPVFLGMGPPWICGAAIEAMILRLDGVVSPYYAGLNLCILAVGVLYTWHWRHALIASGTIVAMWLTPAIPDMLHRTLDFRLFFNNLYFLLLTSVISVASTVTRYRAAQREHAALTAVASKSDELSITLERLQELDRLKNEFFANISHELRTPLTLILAPLEQLLEQDLTPPQRRSLTVVQRNSYRLLRLIDDLLELARLESGGLRLRIGEVDLTELARKVVEAAQPAALTRNVELSLHTAGPVPWVHGDPHRLEIVITNLVTNALKFTPLRGAVNVSVEQTDDGIALQVEDTGPGIAEAEQSRIFDRFYQVEGSERRRHGGAGIGLALARELTELHDGTLTVQSQVGEGATFRLWLPTGRDHFRPEVIERRRARTEQHPGRRVEDQQPPPSLASSVPPGITTEEETVRLDRGRRARILVAEDESDLREFISNTLEREFEILVASDGAEALELVKQQRPDLVLTDVMMPGVSGTDVCRAIKRDPQLRSTPVIMLTARTGSDATLEGYAAGADDFVTKPFHTRVLVARVKAQLKLRALSLQLADHARLVSTGILAAGIAHEVKNPLNAVLNAARALKAAPATMSDKLLDIVEEGTTRVLDIVSALEDHVRPADGLGQSVCDVRAGIESSLRLLEYKMNGILVHASLTTESPVLASAREVNQVFLNLLDNAVRARPKNIWVQARESSHSVEIIVADDGPGVPRDIAALIFQPFFTTREVGEGSGLGLYLCKRIIHELGGQLSYRDRAGGGAEFVVELPGMESAA